MLPSTRGRGARERVLLGALGSVVVALALCGCTDSPHASTPSTATAGTANTSAAPTSTPTPVPTFRATGTAAENLGYFDYVNQKTLAAHPQPIGRDFIDALVAAGFVKADMQVTADKTTVDLTPGSIQFSVRFKGQCLIGQYGPDGVGYHSEIAPLVSTGNCLIGDTSPINW